MSYWRKSLFDHTVLFLSMLISSFILFNYMIENSLFGYFLKIPYFESAGMFNVNRLVLLSILSLCLSLMCVSIVVLIECLLIKIFHFIRK